MRNLNIGLPQRAVVISRHILSCFLLVSGLSTTFGQTTYYVASTGSDSNSGRSVDAPFRTVPRVNSLVLQPGDQVLFRRRDTFQGTLQLRQSGSPDKPIVIDAYGTGSKPILTGSVPVGNWTSVGGNVWQANCPTCTDQVTGVYRDNAALPLGRYPNLDAANKGYLTVQSHTGKTQLTSQQPLSTNWTGGEAVFRPAQWILNRATVTGQNGNTLSLDGSGKYDVSDNWGHFIQNHPATLDQTGEWYYNPANKTIRLYDSQTNPNTQVITATVVAEVVALSNVSFVSVRNLQITQALSTGLSIMNGSNLIIAGNDITQSGEDGIIIRGDGQQVLLENNLVENINNNGVEIAAYRNVTFRGNTVRRIGLIPGRGKSGDGTYVGFLSGCTANSLIENNVFDNIGYNAVNFSTSSTIQRNQISNFCLTKSDGSGLYIWNGLHQPMSDIHLLSNVVYNGIGAPEGTPGGSYSGANGIYLDDCTTNIEVAGNSVYNCRGYGMFLHGSSNIRLTGNTLYNNDEAQLAIQNVTGCEPRTNVIQNNILVSRSANQPVAKYESNANDLTQYGQFDNNYYVRPFEDQFKIRAVYNPGSGMTGADVTLAGWQTRWNQDRNSFNSPLTYKSQVVSQTGTSLLNESFSANANGWSGWSPYGNGRVEWDNANRLDGGSLRLSFASASNQSNSYGLAWVSIGAVTKGKTYQLLFDGVASGAGKRVQVYPRQLSGGYQDLATRTAFVVGTGRQSYQTTFTAIADESNAVLMVQVDEDGQTAWFDNLRLQEATLTTINPDDCIRLVSNLTGQDKVQPLDGVYRDVKNKVYNQQITVPSFSSVVLLKDNSPAPPPPATPSVTLRDPENPANAVAGLDYGYYEGNWNALPDFNSLTPVKTGTGNKPDLSMRNREDNFGLRYTGYVSVPADGTYTFYTTSDDGSKLLIGTTEVVNNDGGHADQERSGSIGLKAGVHALTIVYFEGGGSQTLTVSYSGPGIGKQFIPDAAYRRAAINQQSGPVATGSGTGLRADYFNNRDLYAPVVLSRTDATVDFDWAERSPAAGAIGIDYFSVRWAGQVEAPITGNYTFGTVSDDGVRLWVNGILLINDWNGHPPTANNGPSIALTAGQKYTIRMEYYEGSGGAVAKLLWSYPGQSQQIIPKTRLYPAAGSGRVAVSGRNEPESLPLMQVYPVPAQESISIRYHAETAGDVTVQLVSMTGQAAAQTIRQVTSGENIIKMAVGHLNRGIYILRLTQGHQHLIRKVLLTE